MVIRTVVIENAAKISLKKAYQYIRKQSYQNAENVRAKILASIVELAVNPAHHPPDKYCIDNNGSYRAYEVFKYRITYHFDDTTIIVLRIKHTKMNPETY
jgi:plasmid stabilization system protein ParE